MLQWLLLVAYAGSGMAGLVYEVSWTRLLTQGEVIPEGERNRAEDVSTVIAFDFLIGNWDRWHGTNTLQDRAGRLVFRDNNGAFYEPMPRGRYEIILAWFQRVQRFSRSFVTHARALTLEALRASDGNQSEAARRLGFTDEQGRLLSVETVLGAAKLAEASQDPAAVLRARVTSKAGTTERALSVMEAHDTKAHLVEAILAAAERSRELGDALGRD